MICHECGAHSTDHVKRGPLEVQLDPPRAYWRGKPFAITPRQAKGLYILCKDGKASHFAIERAMSGEDTFASNASRVQISGLRKRLPRQVQIMPERGWGYKLIIKETDNDDRNDA